MQKKINILVDWLKASKYTVVFTGAGMSTEAGLPDFRSKTGLWKKKDPRKLASLDAMFVNAEEFFEFYRMRLASLSKVSPHKGHNILAEWEDKRIIQTIITQNVDGLHHKAGSEKVIELHGTLREARCLKCNSSYPPVILEREGIPRCHCGGMIKPGVVLFGEMLPQKALQQADLETSQADLFIVIGSSLEVSPANYYPLQATAGGAKLVIINMDETLMDKEADLIIQGKAGEILSFVNEFMKYY